MYPKVFQQLIEHFASLPGIGPKMAERLVLFLFKGDKEKCVHFAEALVGLKDLRNCSQCFNIAQEDQCLICLDRNRNTKKICVVEEALDIIPIERTKAFDGLYHVLGGTLETNTASGSDLTIPQLLARITDANISEVVIATNFTTEGDVTALYLKRKMDPLDVTVTRLARGLATGSDIEYADDMTLKSALTNRANM